MKTIKTVIFFSLLTLCTQGCGSDDDNSSSNTPEDNANQLIEALITEITGGTESIWKIESATLTNNNVTDLDVSDAFNIVDDEFLFKNDNNSQTITLEYRQGNSFNENASDVSDFLLDYYRSTENSTLNITDVENKVFEDTNKTFTYNSNSNITAELSLQGGSLSVNLSPKTSEDFAMPPSGGLNFTEVTTIQKSLALGTTGFTGANSSNSLYIAFRDNTVVPNVPTVYKYDLNTSSLTENTLDPNNDFVTKRAYVSNNKLKVFGGQFITEYDLDIAGTPSFVNHNIGSLTRFGFTTLDQDIYIIGENLDTETSNELWRYNGLSNSFETAANLPSGKAWADIEVVNNKLYIFGGQSAFSDTEPEALSYIYDIDNDSFTSFNLPEALFSSYSARYQNLIYVAGNIAIDADNDNINEDYDNFLGVYNTQDDSFTEITNDLDDSGTNTIKGITVFNNKLFILFDDQSGTPETKIMVTDL